MNRFVPTLLASILAVGLVACSKQGPETAAAPAAGNNAAVSVGLSISTLNNPFFVALRDGAQAEASKDGIHRDQVLSLIHI